MVLDFFEGYLPSLGTPTESGIKAPNPRLHLSTASRLQVKRTVSRQIQVTHQHFKRRCGSWVI